MAHQGDGHGFETPVCRYYVDIRPYAPMSMTRKLSRTKSDDEQLPLLHTLPKETQESIIRYVRKPDRYMSLASALLKHVFVHRMAKIPWNQVQIARTPKPHSRPYWSPPHDWTGTGFEGLEFNVSHQAGMVVLVGCRTPRIPRDLRINDQDEISIRSPAVINPDPWAVQEAESEIDEDEPDEVRIGVDIACTWEPPRTPDLSTQAKLEEWVDVFGEMFSEQEQHDMKHIAVPQATGLSDADVKTRRFYTYWALKEAYIKMVGEGLLAPWLRNLEFKQVPILPQTEVDSKVQWSLLSEDESSRLKVLFENKDISHTMETSLEAFEKTFVIATMTRGLVEQPDQFSRWKELDIYADIGPCATNRCGCLNG